MRFNSHNEVIDWANKTALGDYKRHIANGTDINPFCTNGARNEWQRGFNDDPLASWEMQKVRDFDTIFQRGRAMARIIQKLDQ